MEFTTSVSAVSESATRQHQVESVIGFAARNHVQFASVVRSLLPLIELEKLSKIQLLLERIIKTKKADLNNLKEVMRSPKETAQYVKCNQQ